MQLFLELPLHDNIKLALEEMNMKQMTPIQSQCIPKLLEGNDLMGAAKTGSGKTLAFLVPLVNKILNCDHDPSLGTLAIILSPVRDLSLQIFEVLVKLIKHTSINAGLVIGGNNRNDEGLHLKQGVTILVATPGRLLDHLNNCDKFVYNNLKTLVIDEADRLMEQGFLIEMRTIIKKLPRERQTMLFSATLEVKAAKLKSKMKTMKDMKIENHRNLSLEDKVVKLACYSLKSNCVSVDLSHTDVNINKTDNTISDSVTNIQLQQIYVTCKGEDKFRVLYSFLKNNMKKKIMVFFSVNHQVMFYKDLLKLISINVCCLYGKQSNAKRTKYLEKFKKEEHAIMICTDLAARGLDIPEVDWVVQYDPPNDVKEYIHRVGRTARAGKGGQALLILRDHELGFLKLLQDSKMIMVRQDASTDSLAKIQDSFEKIIKSNDLLRDSAVKAFRTFITAYKTNKLHCFDIYKLDLMGAAKTFGLDFVPKANIEPRTVKRKVEKSAGYNSSDNDYFVPIKSKNI